MNRNRILTLKNGYHLWSRTENIGEKNKLISVHGGPGDTHESFEILHSYLSHIEITYYDQLGSFYSDQPDFKKDSLAQKYLNINYFVHELEEVRHFLGYKRMALLGYSWGGIIAFEYALKYPKRVSELIIIGMSGKISDFDEGFYYKVRDFMGQKRTNYLVYQANKNNFQDKLYKEIIGKFYKKYFNFFSHSYTKHYVETTNTQVANYMLGKNPFRTEGSISGWNIMADLYKVKTRTLLVIGDNDFISPKKAKETTKKMPNANLKIIPNATHVSLRDQPSYIFRQINNFLF